MIDKVKLTEYSHGGGCGCKIAPQVLDEILKSNSPSLVTEKLLVGNSSRDDAAVYDMGNGSAIISTTDFFMPIVNDAFDFGRIASANAISDVYAMGGTPMMAIAILGWPVNKLSAEVAAQVLEGARAICAEAAIPLAGGHSIDSPEPIFGLAVTGAVQLAHLKRNDTAREGDLLFLTKALGVGILSTAQKRNALKPEHEKLMMAQLTKLNKVGEALGKIPGVHALTDVTGFGLLGHLAEMAGGSNLSAEVSYSKLRMLPGLKDYIAQKIYPGATARNRDSHAGKIIIEDGVGDEAMYVLPDPQTNGGLLVAVSSSSIDEVKSVFVEYGLSDYIEPIGKMQKAQEKSIIIKP